MTDHDQRFKELLREFFPDFFALFFPDWVDRFDFSQLEWLDKELFTDPPQGERRFIDLVAKVAVRQALALPGQPDIWLALLHVEIESAEALTGLRPRMSEYYHTLRHRLKLPVLPVALLLRVGLEGIGWDIYEERFWEQTVFRLDYAYVGLPALKGEDYLQGTNWLGVALAALMQLPAEQKARLKAEALRRLVHSGENDWRRFLLCDTVETYLPLEKPQLKEYEDLLVTEPYREVLPMMQSTYDKGIAKGIEQGIEQGMERERRRIVRRLLEARFGRLSEAVEQKLQALSAEQLDALLDAIAQRAPLRELGLED